METTETVAKQIEELVSRITGQGFSTGFDVRRFFGNIYGEDNIKFIYPKNIFEEDAETLVFYIAHGNCISVVSKKKSSFIFETHKLNVENLVLERQSDLRFGAELSLRLCNGTLFDFKSLVDSNGGWKERYAVLIQEIYDELVK